jgi:hypothetical protein
MEEGLEAPVPLIDGVEGGDGGETVVKNHVILGRYTMSTRVENQRHQRRVFGREANKDALAGTAVPLGNLLAVLQGRIKHIDRTSKDMGAGNVGVSGLDPRPQFHGRKTVSVRWETIVHPNGV